MKKVISEDERAAVSDLREAFGYTYTQISQMTGVSRTGVYRVLHPEADRVYNRKHAGMVDPSEERYHILLEEQDGKCAICFGPPDRNRILYWDHDHSTGRARGLLCHKCNILLEHAVKYMMGYVAYAQQYGMNLST